MRLDELGKHQQIPELLAFFNQEDRQYLILELLEDLLAVLKFVHDNNVIHRDIKPENKL